jgi:hypothetical protein
MCRAGSEERTATLAALESDLQGRKASLVEEWSLLKQRQDAYRQQDAACKVCLLR